MLADMSMVALLSTIEAWTRHLTRATATEVALVWPLSADGSPGGQETVVIGTPGSVRLTPREVFSQAIAVGATSVVIAHTHARDTGPSADDQAVTRRLVAAGAILGVPLIAHLVVEPSRVHELIEGSDLRSAA